MATTRTILIVGGGTAGWLCAAYLARFFELSGHGRVAITLVESPEIGIVGVGEGTFPTIRTTLQFLGLDEARFVRETSATFKQGVRFDDWLHAPEGGRRHHYLHPFEAPLYDEGASLVPYWLLQDKATRPPFADAVTIQNRVMEKRRAPKRPDEGDFTGPLNYAYHFDAVRVAQVLADRARELGVRHIRDRVTGVEIDETGAIDYVHAERHGTLAADLFIDCSGFRAELIGRALDVPFRSVRTTLFADRALACKLPYERADMPIESTTIATAHEAGWIWDIGLENARGIGCIYSSDHIDDDRAADILRQHIGDRHAEFEPRRITFEPGYRERQWVRNCVAVGLAGGFLEPLESTGVVLIEAAAAMIAEFFPYNGPVDASAHRFNTLMAARYDKIVAFLKLHYCLSRRTEPFWRDNTEHSTIPDSLLAMLQQWRHRPPSRFDFSIDVETFAFFNYQYVLYGMDFDTDVSARRGDPANEALAGRMFAKIRSFGDHAAADLPAHRDFIRQLNAMSPDDAWIASTRS